MRVGHDSGVVVWLCVGSGEGVGGSDANGRGSASVLEEGRVECWPVRVQQATLAAVIEFE